MVVLRVTVPLYGSAVVVVLCDVAGTTVVVEVVGVGSITVVQLGKTIAAKAAMMEAVTVVFMGFSGLFVVGLSLGVFSN